MNKTSKTIVIIFTAFAVISLAAVFKFAPKRQRKSPDPLAVLSSFLRGRDYSQPLPVKMRVAGANELNQASVFDEFSGIKNKKRNAEFPAVISGPMSERNIMLAYLPVYPGWAKGLHRKVEVKLWFHVNPQGQVVSDMSTMKSSGYADVDALAVETLKKWLFYPSAREDNQAGEITFTFKL